MKYFSFSELERSVVAQFQDIDNTMPLLVRASAEAFVDGVLDPLREAFGAPLVVSSGYRCEALNRLVGGSPSSQHLLGTAADISAVNPADNRRLWELIGKGTVDFDQAILYGDYRFVHIGWRRTGKNRRQMLVRNTPGAAYRQD